MGNILDQIDKIQDKIFAEWTPNILEDAIGLMESIIEILPELSLNQQNNYLILLNQLEKSIQNKDFLLTADLLEFELKPLIRNGRV